MSCHCALCTVHCALDVWVVTLVIRAQPSFKPLMLLLSWTLCWSVWRAWWSAESYLSGMQCRSCLVHNMWCVPPVTITHMMPLYHLLLTCEKHVRKSLFPRIVKSGRKPRSGWVDVPAGAQSENRRRRSEIAFCNHMYLGTLSVQSCINQSGPPYLSWNYKIQIKPKRDLICNGVTKVSARGCWLLSLFPD